jgi:hypothetical protein
MTDNWYQEWKARPLTDRLKKLPRGLGIIETADLCAEAADALSRLLEELRTARLEALEEAAKVADDHEDDMGHGQGAKIAAAIRSLKGE